MTYSNLSAKISKEFPHNKSQRSLVIRVKCNFFSSLKMNSSNFFYCSHLDIRPTPIDAARNIAKVT
jgi:hypothetical protein